MIDTLLTKVYHEFQLIELLETGDSYITTIFFFASINDNLKW